MICTFYSYKGGAGRSLALANLAELFYSAGHKVLLVDWDLETPGLERYFPSLDLQRVLDQPGLLDMLHKYKEYMAQEPEYENAPFELESPAKYLISIYDEQPNSGKLYLLTAGRRSPQHIGNYKQSVLAFKWQDFYKIWYGELYFNWLREQFEKIADIILIDCRAGDTEMGNVCTNHLADVIVMFCTPDQQNLQGTYEMAQKFTAEKVRQIRAARPLKVMIVPSRIDDQVKAEQLSKLKQEFVDRFSVQDFSVDSGLITIGDEIWALHIPQALNNLFADRLLVQQSSEERHKSTYQAYCRLAEYLAQQTPENSHIHELMKLAYLQNRSYPARKNDQLSESGVQPQYELKPGLLIKTCCEVNLRPTPGYIDKPINEIVRIKQGSHARILEGPRKVNDLSWWRIECKIRSCKLTDNYIHWKYRDFPRNLAVHSSEPLKAIIERSDQGTLIIFGWVAEKTPNGVSQLQEIDVKLSTQEKHLLPDSPSFEMPGEQTFDNMDINTVEQKAQPEVVTVGR